MGFMDIFRKKKNDFNNYIMYNKKTINNSDKSSVIKIQHSAGENGELIVELTNNTYDKDYFYNITRLVLSPTPTIINGYRVENCSVSWYNQSDINDSQRQHSYNVLAEIDGDLLLNDVNYCMAVMSDLLNRGRINKYFLSALKDNPETPCGIYVGGIQPDSSEPMGYLKFFNNEIGEIAHILPEMVEIRERYKRDLAAKSANSKSKSKSYKDLSK